MDLREIINNLNNIGFYSVFLPFILVYVVVYAILEKSNIFSKKNDKDSDQTKNVNAIIAFVFGLFVVASVNTVMYIQSLIINVILFIIFILVILILLGFIFGEDYKELFKNKNVKWGLFGIVIITISVIFLNILGFWDWINSINIENSNDIYSYLILFIIGGVIYFVSKGESNNNNNSKK